MSQNSFHNQDLSNLIYQNQQLRLQKKQSDQLISSLENENEHLKRSIRLHRIVVRPNAKGSRTGQGNRQYDDRDLIISRLEAQILTLTDTLSTYSDRAYSLERKRQERLQQEKQARLDVQGPVDLTVAWRPKKNVISERTEMFSKRAAKRRAKKAKENKTIENEQRDLLLEQYAKKANKTNSRTSQNKTKYNNRRAKRISELIHKEMEYAKQIEREQIRKQLAREEKRREEEEGEDVFE